MDIETSQITVNGVQVQIVRKAIKNLHLGVYPPHGRVRVAAPLAVTDEAIRLAVIVKLGWIKRQRARFDEQPRQTLRDMVTGESHYFLGRRYRLRVIRHEGAAKVVLLNKSTIELHIQKISSPGQRERVLHAWYRQELKALIPPLVEKWQAALGVQVADWGVKKMKTKWGTCNVKASRIWLNLELAKKPVQCLEFVMAHEMVHLLERNHNDHFIGLMDKHLPHWRTSRQELNAAPLAHETWTF